MNDFFAANAADITQRLAAAPHPAREPEATLICTAPRLYSQRYHSESGYLPIAETYAVAERLSDAADSDEWVIHTVSVVQGRLFTAMMPQLYDTKAVTYALQQFEAKRPESKGEYTTDLTHIPLAPDQIARHYSHFSAFEDAGRTFLRHKLYKAAQPR